MWDYPIKVEEMRRHLAEKYGESFIPLHGIGAGINHLYTEAVFCPESHPEIRLRIYDKGGRFADDYFRVLAEEPFQAMLTDALGGEEGVRVFFAFNASAFPEKYTRAEQLPDALTETPIAFFAQVEVLIREDVPYDAARWDRGCEQLREAGITGIFRGWRVPEETFADADGGSFREILMRTASERCVFKSVIREEERKHDAE